MYTSPSGTQLVPILLDFTESRILNLDLNFIFLNMIECEFGFETEFVFKYIKNILVFYNYFFP